MEALGKGQLITTFNQQTGDDLSAEGCPVNLAEANTPNRVLMGRHDGMVSVELLKLSSRTGLSIHLCIFSLGPNVCMKYTITCLDQPTQGCCFVVKCSGCLGAPNEVAARALFLSFL